MRLGIYHNDIICWADDMQLVGGEMPVELSVIAPAMSRTQENRMQGANRGCTGAPIKSRRRDQDAPDAQAVADLTGAWMSVFRVPCSGAMRGGSVQSVSATPRQRAPGCGCDGGIAILAVAAGMPHCKRWQMARPTKIGRE